MFLIGWLRYRLRDTKISLGWLVTTPIFSSFAVLFINYHLIYCWPIVSIWLTRYLLFWDINWLTYWWIMVDIIMTQEIGPWQCINRMLKFLPMIYLWVARELAIASDKRSHTHIANSILYSFFILVDKIIFNACILKFKFSQTLRSNSFFLPTFNIKVSSSH